MVWGFVLCWVRYLLFRYVNQCFLSCQGSEVPAAFVQEPICPRETSFFASVIGSEGVTEVEERRRGEGGFSAADEVDMGGNDMVGVEETHDAGDHHAPVSALGRCRDVNRD